MPQISHLREAKSITNFKRSGACLHDTDLALFLGLQGGKTSKQWPIRYNCLSLCKPYFLAFLPSCEAFYGFFVASHRHCLHLRRHWCGGACTSAQYPRHCLSLLFPSRRAVYQHAGLLLRRLYHCYALARSPEYRLCHWPCGRYGNPILDQL